MVEGALSHIIELEIIELFLKMIQRIMDID